MAPSQSNLSDPKYLYDFVVSTTQESINAGLVQYLHNTKGKQPLTYLCFLADNTGAPTIQKSLDEILQMSGGLNPFDIPDGTDYRDPRINKLTEVRFVCGIQMQSGIPPGCVVNVPKKGPQVQLPEPIVTLGNTSDNVLFNMYCSSITVIKNNPPGGWNSAGSWQWFSQPSGKPWYIKTRTNLLSSALDKSLDTPYFQSHPEERDALRQKLNNISGSAFSLQQLVVNLDSAVAQTAPSFVGVTDRTAEFLLTQSFINIWSSTAKAKGLPLIGVTAVAQQPDGSPLRLTGLERWVSPVVDPLSGLQITDPSPLQSSATTLNYLCATDSHPLPGAASFNWNWIEPQDVAQSSGVIAIKRSTIGAFLAKEILPKARESCIKPWTGVKALDIVGGVRYSWSFASGQEPTVNIKDSGPLVATIDYSHTSNAWDKMAATYGELNMTSTYSCSIFFGKHDTTVSPPVDLGGNIFTIVQSLKISVYLQWSATGRSANVLDKTLSDEYVISVDNSGGLISSASKSSSTDKSSDGDVGWLVNAFTNVGDMLADIRHRSGSFLNAQISTIPFNQIRNFVFPGAKVFSYKTAAFSKHHDLVSLITYINPTVSRESARSMMLSEASFRINSIPDRLQEGVTITTSTDMMLNYVQGELVKPQGKFQALQTTNGNALLFAIDSFGAFNVIEEATGQTQTGWRATDLSKIIKERFPSGAKATAFDVGQNVMNENTISLAMSVRANGSDTLLLSLFNSPSSTSWWIANPNWQLIPFDAENPPSSIQITNIYISETEQQQQYIMVDILRDPTSPLKDTARYIVDPFTTSGVYWTPHTLPFDVEEGTYQSCMGRVSNAYVDGIYTAGTVKDVAQLAYVPLFNLSGDAAPMPTRLVLPNRTVASAIASARNNDRGSSLYGTTDLYAVGQSTLYRWDPDQQLNDSAVGTALLTNPVFAGTSTIIALTRNRVTTIFGKNASNVVYYTSCYIDRLADPNSWSVPVPVLHGIERITSYINVKDGGNTVFAAGGNKIQKLTQATGTTSKLWQAQPITLAASPQSKAVSFNSYTSIIQVKGEDGLPVTGAEVVLTTEARTPVYIDGLYYILSTTPITVPVNQSGQVIIIQATDSIVGATIFAKIGNTTQTIDPMAKSFAKLAQLSDKNALKDAQIRTDTTAGGVMGTPKTAPLVSSSVSDNDLQATSQSIRLLTDAYNKQTSKNSALPSFCVAAPVLADLVVPQKSIKFDLGDYLAISAGDLFNWLKTGVKNVIDIIKNAATGLWEFIVKIGNQVYRAILDTVEAIVGAVEWVFNKIKTGVETLIRYVEFLFEWDDIRRTKQVMYNLVRFYMMDMVSGIKTAQSQFDNSIADAQKAVAELSGIKDWTPLGDSASKPPSGIATDPSKDQTSGSQMMASHFRNQADNMTMPQGMPEISLVQSLVDDMMKAMASQGLVFTQTFDQLKALAADFLKLSLADILKRLAGILVESVLVTTQVVVDAMLNVLHQLASTAIAVLDTKIHIPIISDILNAIGFPDISFLDLFTWIGAAGITIVFKIARGKAPFADDATSRALIQAKDWNSFSAALSSLEFSQSVGNTIYSAGHAITGFIAFTGNFLFFAEAMDVSPANVFGIPSAIMGVIGAAAAGGADALVAKMPLDNTAISVLRKITTVATIMSKLIFSGLGQKYLATGRLSFLKANDNRKVGAVFNTALVFPALICTCYHFYELSQKPVSKERSLAIIGETSSMVQYLGRISYCVAIFDPDPETRVIPASVMAGSNVVMFVLETAGAVAVVV
ncbi:hypothetical protein M430DRAFT_141905 [Amorphotheca resinae ATCC 22711]|uniref:Uncharacterized protein n=1 Tax=Amorphotheca resinae ATCC 22711 TaxID=857342 RepID=A0A2T3AXF6_AMORE|nr:hypothetical protein M430DRAFT_141905 [Amorphotheca resinae ATCC 22711]PSS14759.1 hypothetical protein M430DRAFT_141905 [Amorphotheca resinae ATCC 22711]